METRTCGTCGYIPEAEGSVVPGELGFSRENSEDQSCAMLLTPTLYSCAPCAFLSTAPDQLARRAVHTDRMYCMMSMTIASRRFVSASLVVLERKCKRIVQSETGPLYTPRCV